MIWKADHSKAKQSDHWLVLAIMLLATFGLIMLTSTSSIAAYQTYKDGYYFFKHQAIHLLIGGFLFWLLTRFDYRRLQALALPIFVASLLMLLLVFIPGLASGARAHSWINIFGFSLQPSEFVKLGFLIYLSALFATEGGAKTKTKAFAMSYGLIAMLMALQPDLGTLIIITAIALALYFINGGSIKKIGAFIVFCALALSLFLAVKEYQRDRFRCFLNPQFSAGDKCYQINQSLIAVGSGGVIGRGLGNSRQKFLYLPEVQNDFIFSVIAEEVGFVFSGLLIFLYVFIFTRGQTIAKTIGEPFGKNLAIGIVTWLMVQTIVNIGGAINFIPMTGVPLPLVSYGGTAIIAVLASLGILVNISRRVKT
jgi:cell division protein FtsW